MSIRIERSKLTTEQKELIRKLLCLYPQEAPQFSKQKNFYTEAKEPILFFEVDDKYINIPYAFGNTLLQSFPNMYLQKHKMAFHFTKNLLDHQVEVVEEARVHLQTKGTTTLGTYPGSGKTVMGAYLSVTVWPDPSQCEMVLVLHPMTVLNASWANTFREFTDARVWVVGDEPVPSHMPNVIVCLDQRIDKIPPGVLESIGFLILDEAHKLCTPSKVHALLATQPKYVVAETATLSRDDGMESMIHSMCGNHAITRISTKPFNVIKLMTGICPEVVQGAKGADWNALVDTIYKDPIRNKMIVEMIRDNIAKGFKIIVLTLRKDHVTMLQGMLREIGIRCDVMLGTKKSYSDSDCLLGTVSKIGTGFDERTNCPDFGGRRADLLIYCASTKKEAVMEQNFGRVCRASFPSVIHLVDDNPIIKKHWTICKKWYESRNGILHEVKIPKQTRTYNIDGTCSGIVEMKIADE